MPALCTRSLPLLLLLYPACRHDSGSVARVSVEPKRVQLGYRQSVSLRLAWQTMAPLEKLHGNPKVFVHLLERPGHVLRTFDHALPEQWRPGRPQGYEIDLYQSALGQPLPPGNYPLTLGLYDDSWGYRWPLDTGGPDVGRREYQVATVVVPSDPVPAPRFEFSGRWEPVSAGMDQQILGRRWLRGRGTIFVQGIDGTGVALLLVNVPGRGPASVLLSNNCEPGKQERLPPGDRWLELSIDRRRDGSCEILFQPDPPADPAGQREGRSLCLEVLAWKPAR